MFGLWIDKDRRMWEAGEEMPPPGGKSCSEYVGSSSKVIDHSPVSYYATSQDLSRSVRTCIIHRSDMSAAEIAE
jgi:hypothetical protein